MKKVLSFFIIVFGFFQAQSQSVDELMSQDKTYAEVCDIMHQKFQGKSFTKGHSDYSREYKQFKRWEYFWKHRLMPNGDFPASNMIYDAWQSTEPLANRVTLRGGGNGEADWEYFGPKNLPTSSETFYPGLGRINAIAVHPTNHDIIFAGGAGSGIWKTTDKGTNWSPKTDMLPNVGISSIVIDPNNANTIYAATGDADGRRGLFSTGILKSTDLGETWTIVGLSQEPSDQFFTRRMAMPATPANTLIITTNDGIQKSTDGGMNFNTVSNADGFGIFKASNNDTDFYVGTSDGRILKSTDTGDSWTDITPSTPNLTERVELGLTADDPNFIIAIDAMGVAIKSTDGGTSWTATAAPPQYDSQGGYNMTIAISPNDKNRIIIGGVDGWRSTDGGASWEKYLDGYWEAGTPYFYVHSDHHAMTFVPGSDILMVGNDGGVHYGDITQDIPFTDISEGLFVTQYYGIGALRTDAGVIIGGTQDNDGTFINGNNITGMLPASDGFDGMVDYSDVNISYAAIVGGSVSKTTDAWVTELYVDIPEYWSNWEVPMAMHPTTPSTIFFGGNKLMKSTDAGDNWTSLFDITDMEDGINELSIAPSNGDNIIFSTSGGELKRTTDGGQNWSDINAGLPLNENIRISGIAVHATNPDIIYVSLSGFDADNKVFKSVDAGQNWTDMTYNLPNIPVNHIAYAAGTDDDVYIATDLGVYFNSAGADTWTFFNTNLPYTQVIEIEFHYGSNTVFAGTFGRGIWKSGMANNVMTATAEFEEQSGIKIFPSPSNGVFNIEIENFEANQDYDIVIFNAIGGVVYHQKYSGLVQQVDISNVVNGTYFVSIRKNGQLFTQKIIINGK